MDRTINTLFSQSPNDLFAQKNISTYENETPSLKKLSVSYVKSLGLIKTPNNLNYLLMLYKKPDISIDVKREIVSSIGRQADDTIIYNFIKENVYTCNCMDLVYQMYRTCLYKNNSKFKYLEKEIEDHFNNEMIFKMKKYKKRSRPHSKKDLLKISTPLLLEGDNTETLQRIPEGSINFIFTSPPYYNAREYSDYTSYDHYLAKMKKSLLACHRVLEDGRFIIINVSPVITKRPGREFESIRYPIHYDFHKILKEAGFYFIDEIIWIKPEASCPNRNGGYQQTKLPLSYKPNCITESLMVYRKNCDFLLDENIKKYSKILCNDDKIDSSNSWYISPKYDKNHPAVFPEELCEKVLKYYSFKRDVVLDPFAGSGTFGKVALAMDRTPILCEANARYCSLIRKNINGIL